MNIAYSIDKALRIVTLSYSGNPNFDEWSNMMIAVFRDPNFEPGFSLLMDRRLVTTSPTTDYIEKIAAFTKARPNELGKCRTAVVVSEMASFGMARMFQALSGDSERTQVFKDFEKAKRWLCFPGTIK